MTLFLATAVALLEAREIVVVPLGSPAKKTMRLVQTELVKTFSAHISTEAPVALPKNAFYLTRSRYRAEKLIAFINRYEGTRIIGITDRDISTTHRGRKDWGVMGLAHGRACVASSFRAKSGVGKVAVHEVGHTLGLPHCPNRACVMQDAQGSARIATSSGKFCQPCTSKIKVWLR